MTSAHRPGDNRVFRKECRTLAKAGYEVYYVVPGGETGDCDGVHVVGTGEKPASRLKRFTAMAKLTYEAAKALDCDVYHFHDTELLPYGLKLAKAGKTVIFDSHECYPLLFLEKEYIPKPLRGLAGSIYKAYETHVVRQLAAVIIPFTVEGKNVFEGRAKRTVILDNLPELASFPTEIPPRVDAENTVGYVGRLSESRGITELIQGCYRAGVRLRLAGPIPEEYHNRLKAMPEYSCVEYWGWIPYTQVPEFCSKISIGMSTILDIGQHFKMDNLVTKTYEYMSMALPIIISDTLPGKWLMDEYEVGLLVNPADPDAVAAAIRKLLADPERADAMGKLGRQAVLEKYNWETEGQKLVELYRDLTGGPEGK